MPDLRLYRLAFGPALLAFVALMFSLQGAPPPLEPAISPATFEPARATATARATVAEAPDRSPGSAGDAAAADLVAERFGEIRAGTVSEQQVSTSLDGDDVTLRNVLFTLPGDTATTVVVLAPRDSERGPGAATSAAATGALVELAATLGVSGHAKTYILASTSGGESGARAVIDGLPDRDALEAVLVLWQPGAADPQAPFVVASSTGPNRTAAQLTATAERAVAVQARLDDPGRGFLNQLARLAFPSGLGLQAPLVDAGIDAVAISSAGERTLDPDADGLDDLSRSTLGGFGRAATSIVSAIDVAEEPLRHGPTAYVEVGDNLVPGWALALLALALLLPAALAATDAAARAARRRERLAGALAWAGSRAAPAVAGLLALYVLALLGLVPRPSFPFDPGRYELGAAGVASLVLIAAAMVGAGVLAARRLGPTGVTGPSLAAASGIVAVLAGALAWLANPYLALLVVPAVHAWVLAAAGVRAVVVAIAVAVALLPLAVAVAAVALALDLGAQAPWTLLIMVADRQIGFWATLALCLLAGSMATALAAARRGELGSRP